MSNRLESLTQQGFPDFHFVIYLCKNSDTLLILRGKNHICICEFWHFAKFGLPDKKVKVSDFYSFTSPLGHASIGIR
jgi:hypothetical protein